MATNLLIGYPSIPLAATAALSSGSASSTYPLSNLFGGNRTDRFELATAASGNIQINLPLSAAASADFVYVGGASRLLASGVSSLNVRSHTSNTYASGSDATLSNALSTANLVGPGGEDYLATFTAVSRQYWWVNTNASGSSNRVMDKLFLGAAFDMGRDPDEDGGFVVTRTRPSGSQRRAAYAYDVTWSGVSYSTAVSFHALFVRRRRYQPVVLFTTSYHAILNSHKVVFCRLAEASSPPRATGYCDVTARFEELP